MSAIPRAQWSLCGSCRARIVWAKTPTGKNTPVDVTPTSDGDHVLVVGPQGWLAIQLRGDNAAKYRVAPDAPRFRTHWGTCPNANEHRKLRGARP